MAYKTIDALMRHLRNSGIAINGGKQKRQLINTGYCLLDEMRNDYMALEKKECNEKTILIFPQSRISI